MGSAFACCRPSFPTLHAPCLLNPFEHLWSLRLLQGLHFDVAASVGGSERRRRVKFRAAEENHIHGHIVGDHLDDPPELRQPVVRLLPLDGVLKPGNLLANQFVYPLDDRMQIRHDAANPILNVGVAIRRLGWLTGCTWLACFRHRCILRRRTTRISCQAGCKFVEPKKTPMPAGSTVSARSAMLFLRIDSRLLFSRGVSRE